MVWHKAPGVRNDDIRAVKFGGRLFRSDQFEQQIEADLSVDPDDDSDAPWNKPGWYERYEDAANRNNNLAEYGELPPLAPPDVHSQKVLAEALTKKE